MFIFIITTFKTVISADLWHIRISHFVSPIVGWQAQDLSELGYLFTYLTHQASIVLYGCKHQSVIYS